MGHVVDFPDPESRQFEQQPEPSMAEGYTRIVNELVEALAMAPLGAGHFRVMFAVIRQTYGWQKTRDRISGSQLANLTGMARQTCNRLIKELAAMNLIHRVDGRSVRINTRVSTWNTAAKPRHYRQGVPATGTDVVPPHEKDGTGTDGGSKTGTDVGSTTGTDGVTHKRKERKKEKERESQTPSSAVADTPTAYEPSEKIATTKRDSVPYQAIVEAYHEILPELPQVQKLTPKRKKQIAARWHDTYGAQQKSGASLHFWRRYLWYVKRSKFLCGLKDGCHWRADVDFLFRESGMVQVIEGKYHSDEDIRADLPVELPAEYGGEA